MNVVLDTNILFAALRSQNFGFRETRQSAEYTFYTPNFLIVEIFKHKERIIKKSKASADEINEYLNKVLQHIRFVNEEFISVDNALKAYSLCRGIDEKDTPFVALTFELKGKLWTRDKELREGLKESGFNDFFNQ